MTNSTPTQYYDDTDYTVFPVGDRYYKYSPHGDIVPASGSISYIDPMGKKQTIGNKDAAAPAPVTPSTPASNFVYRPANQYQQYYSGNQTDSGYGRSPLVPFTPLVQASSRPSAASLIAAMGRAAPIGSAAPASPAAMASGGPVRGVGGGQEDNVLTTARPKSFIIPADVVADLGDGSSKEGHKRLGQTWARLGYAVGGSVSGQQPNGVVPVALSPDEHEVPPEIVSALGNGSNSRGTGMLHTMIRKVRAHKARKGMPPPAKSPLTYMTNR